MSRTPLSLRSFLLGLPFIVFAFASDQITKQLILEAFSDPSRIVRILPFFNLRLGFNSGVSFGLFATDQPLILSALTLVVVGILLWWLLQAKSLLEIIGIGGVIGGALGNILDRLRIGAVVDFLDLHYGDWHWPTFNVADIFIVSGVALIVVSALAPRQVTPPKQ